MATASNRRREKRSDFVIFWVDRNVHAKDFDTKNTISQLTKITNEVQLISKGEECQSKMKEFSGSRSFVVISGSLSQSVIPTIHSINDLESIFIFCGQKTNNEDFRRQWPKVKCIHTNIEPICAELKKLVNQVRQDTIAMSIIDVTIDDNPVPDMNRLEPSFMYTSLLKETLLKTQFTRTHINTAVNASFQYHENDETELEIIKEFRDTYTPNKAIWWYSRECFLYRDINHALRELEVDIIIDFGFFIRDLHKQIEILYYEQQNMFNRRPFIVYRGQGLSKSDFEKIRTSEGSLLGFNCFLSTSKLLSVARSFAEGGASRLDQVGVLFKMTIDPSLRLVPFADIARHSITHDEAEVLFTIHTIFRIGIVEKLPEYDNVYQLSLALTNEDDPRLKELKEYISKRSGGNVEHNLGWILQEMGHYQKCEEIYTKLLQKAVYDPEKAVFNHCLGFVKNKLGQYQEAIKYYEEAIDYHRQTRVKNDPKLGETYTQIGRVYDNMGQYKKALSIYEESIEIFRETLSEDHPNIATSYNNMGMVYDNMGQYSEALKYYEIALEMRKKHLPAVHSSIANSYNNIGLVYNNKGEYATALLNCEQALAMRNKVLPKSHPDIAESYHNIGLVYSNMKEYAKAYSYLQNAIDIKKKRLPKDHSSLGASYTCIGVNYFHMEQYQEALKYLEDALHIHKLNLPPTHPKIELVNGWISKVKQK